MVTSQCLLPSFFSFHFILVVLGLHEFTCIPVAGEKRKPSSAIKQTDRGKQRMGKTRDLFKKIRDTKGTFHAKMGSIKDKNGMDLMKQKILRGGKNTQKNCTKNSFTTQIIMRV